MLFDIFDVSSIIYRARISVVQSGGAGFERRETLRTSRLDLVRCACVSVNANAIAGRPAQQFVYRHPEQFAFNVPKRLVNSGERTRQNRPSAIESVAINGLPMVSDSARVVADQIRLDFFDRCGAGQRASFGDWLS